MRETEKQSSRVREQRAEYDFRASGVDVVHLRENLKLTPTERVMRHQYGLELALEMRRAGRKH